MDSAGFVDVGWSQKNGLELEKLVRDGTAAPADAMGNY